MPWMRAPLLTLAAIALAGAAACGGGGGGGADPGTDPGGDPGGCVPLTAASCAAAACGAWPDGCGGTVTCGGCAAEACGVAMTDGWCGACSADGFCGEDPVRTDAGGFDAVTAVSDTSVWLVSASGGHVLEWDGTAWRDRSSRFRPDGVTVDGPSKVWGASPGELWGVDGTSLLWRWDGTAWSAASKTGWRARAIDGTAADDVWVVGDAGLIGHWDGAAWSRVTSPTADTLLAVSARARDDAWAAGLGGLYHWDGTGWTRASPPESTTAWRDVRAAAAGEAWLVATNGDVYRWQGTAFESMRAVLGSPVTALWAFGPSDVWMIGASGLVERWNGSAVVPADSGTTVSFRGVAGTPGGDLWLAGYGYWPQTPVLRRAAP